MVVKWADQSNGNIREQHSQMHEMLNSWRQYLTFYKSRQISAVLLSITVTPGLKYGPGLNSCTHFTRNVIYTMPRCRDEDYKMYWLILSGMEPPTRYDVLDF